MQSNSDVLKKDLDFKNLCYIYFSEFRFHKTKENLLKRTSEKMKEPILAVKIIVFGIIIVILSSLTNFHFLKTSSFVMVEQIIKVMILKVWRFDRWSLTVSIRRGNFATIRWGIFLPRNLLWLFRNLTYTWILRDLSRRFADLKISVSGSLPVKFGNKIFPKKIFISPKDAAWNFRGTPLKSFSVSDSLKWCK